VSLPTETFQEHARRRKARGAGHAAINDRIRGFADAKRSSASVREMQQMDREAARIERQLDQGTREPMPPPTDSNAAVNARLRAAFRHEDLDESDTGSTPA
jgi:hypothetical protein